MLEATAEMAAQMRDLASRVPTTIFRWFGATLLGIPPIDAAPSYASSTWTAINADGYTIPTGTVVTIARTGSDVVAYEVVTDVDIPPGSTATAVGEVELQAVLAGADSNGLTANPVLADPLPYIASITLVGSSSGGVDAELDNDYLDRLVEELQLLSPTPIIASDFAALYRRQPGVDRALAIDNYNPADDTYDNEKMVTIFGVDAAGESVGTPIQDAARTMLEAMRETNFIVNTADPTYTSITVSTSFTIIEEADGPTTEDAVKAALNDYFSPANWGKESEREALGVELETSSWEDHNVVYYLEVAQIINLVAGVDHIVTLTVNGGTDNVNLGAPAPLTRPGVMSAVVV